MNPKALNKAQGRLRIVKKHAQEISICKTYGELSDCWTVFLQNAKGIYTVLEQGAKDSPQAMQWFGLKNKERRSDALLRYVTEARNDDEHGIESMTDYTPGSALLGVASPGSSNIMRDENGNTFIGVGTAYRIEGITSQTRLPKLHALDGKPIVNKITQPHARLVEVTDRSKNKYAPPTKHLGHPISDPTPQIVADLTFKYLEELMFEAEGFRKP